MSGGIFRTRVKQSKILDGGGGSNKSPALCASIGLPPDNFGTIFIGITAYTVGTAGVHPDTTREL
jgi:hypothetical protein